MRRETKNGGQRKERQNIEEEKEMIGKEEWLKTIICKDGCRGRSRKRKVIKERGKGKIGGKERESRKGREKNRGKQKGKW
mgnify:CR=1 FL=1